MKNYLFAFLSVLFLLFANANYASAAAVPVVAKTSMDGHLHHKKEIKKRPQKTNGISGTAVVAIICSAIILGSAAMIVVGVLQKISALWITGVVILAIILVIFIFLMAVVAPLTGFGEG